MGVRSCLAAVAAGLAVIVAAAAVGAKPLPAVTIFVTDYSEAPHDAIIEAQHVVAGLFGTAGVKSIWREETAPPSVAGEPNRVAVLILSSAMADRKCAAEDIPETVLGHAAPYPARRAWVFFERIRDAARLQERSVGRALGLVIAHEVAHMLGELAHAERGIMEQTLQAKGHLAEGFTPEQGARIRSALEHPAGPVTLMTRRR